MTVCTPVINLDGFVPVISEELVRSNVNHGHYSPDDMDKLYAEGITLYRALRRHKSPRSLAQRAELLNIVGPPGAGKTMLADHFMKERKRKAHSILFDVDNVRAVISCFQESLLEHLEAGLSLEQADRKAMGRWNSAIRYITQALFVSAQLDGFNLVRCGTLDGQVTREICARTGMAGYMLNTLIVLAPQLVCLKSIELRKRTGGHPVDKDYFEQSFVGVERGVHYLLEKSDRTRIFWRDCPESSAQLAVSITPPGELVAHNAAAVAALEKHYGLTLGPVLKRNGMSVKSDTGSCPLSLG